MEIVERELKIIILFRIPYTIYFIAKIKNKALYFLCYKEAEAEFAPFYWKAIGPSCLFGDDMSPCEEAIKKSKQEAEKLNPH